MQLLIRKFYCFRPGLHIYFKYARHNHLCCPMMGATVLGTFCLLVLVLQVYLFQDIN